MQFEKFSIFLLTLSWPGKILLRPKIRCFNFKPQYLLNYTSPTNDLYSVRKRSIGAFKSIFKLLGLGPASAGPCAQSFLREVLRWRAASPHWLRTLRQNFARVVSLLAFQHVSKHAGDALTQCWYQWDKRGTNENWENGKYALIFLLIFLRHFLGFWDITSIFREKAPNAMQYCLKLLLKGLLYHTISWCVNNLQKQNVPNLAHWPS